MATIRRPLGFADAVETAKFFGIPKRDVMMKAESGEWKNYCIAGRRVFDLDAILDELVNAKEAS